MCIFCTAHMWVQMVSANLPWLVFPLIGLWALSQLLPQPYRFEITSSRLACLVVLLVSLFWYEILMPRLSSWRARRSAWLRERKRIEAIELQKLRKMAIRRCRNCFTPYRDQNPCGGKFMCSYCGHISKRPVLSIPGFAEMAAKKSGFFGEFMSSGNTSMDKGFCSHSVLENGNRIPAYFKGNNSWANSGGRLCNNNDRCLRETSYSGVFVSLCRLLSSLFLSIRWLWRKVFKIPSREDELSDPDHKGLSRKGENGLNNYESKSEKARRKAEEKRQARLERELLEEEERKQREEVTQLVEERRRLRDEKMEAEKVNGKGSTHHKEKNSKREAERKRQDRRKEKDKGSIKSNSDCEERDRRVGKETEIKRDFDKRSEPERQDHLKTANYNRGSGTKYLERVKGSLLSSSRAFRGTSFFRNGSHTSATTVSKAYRPNGFVDHPQGSVNRRNMHGNEHVPRKLNSNGDRKVVEISPPQNIGPDMQPQTPLKKSWHQLFTRSPAVPPTSSANSVGISNLKPQIEAQRLYFPLQPPQASPLGSQSGCGISFPSIVPPSPNGFRSRYLHSSSEAEQVFSLFGEPPHNLAMEEPEIFEDPCYVPDPVALLGPVSESLDNFSCNLGTGFVGNILPQKSGSLNSVPAETSKLSPIESPVSRLRGVGERHTNSSPFPCSPKTPERSSSPMSESNEGTWQMWDTTPLGQDTLGIVGGPASWLLPVGQNPKDTASNFVVNKQLPPGYHLQQRALLDSFSNGGEYAPYRPVSFDSDPWSSKPIFQPLAGDGENHFPPLTPLVNSSQNGVTYGSSSLQGTNRWSKNSSPVHGSEEVVVNPLKKPHIGSLFSTPDVQSLWSFN